MKPFTDDIGVLSAAGDGRLLRSIIDALPQAVVATDPTGHIVLWNEGAERLYGWPEADVLGRSVLDVLAPGEQRAQDAERLAALAAGAAFTGDRVVVRRDGQLVRVLTFARPVVDRNGDVSIIVGASEDVTALRATERRAREVTEHLRLALEAGGLGTWRWEMRTGATAWDERLEALFGLSRGGFDGTFETFVSCLHPDDREEVLASVKSAVETQSTYRVEHRVVWPDGSIRWISGAGAVLLDEDGIVTGTVGCAADVTDRVHQELERRELAEAAVEAAANERVLRERLEFVSAINEALNQSETLRDVMVNVTARAVPRLGDWCSVHVLRGAGNPIPEVEVAHVDPGMVAYARQLQDRFPYDPNAPKGVAHVIRTGETIFYPEITDDVVAELDATDEEREIVAQLALRSAIVVPLVKRGKVLGAMQFVMSSTGRQYTTDDVALAHAVAGRIASSIENHRLSDLQRTIASTLQRSLLPSVLPDIPGVEIAVRYWPAGEQTEVGGDFYDVFALDRPSTFAVVMGDVCGTGPAAAALTGLARHSIRSSAWHGDNPAEVLTSLNRDVLRSGTGTFLTATYAELNASGPGLELTVASGGHPLPVLSTSGGTRLMGEAGTLLGIVDEPRSHPETVHLEPGDAVVFYTDGATDVRPPHGLTATEFARIVSDATAAAGSAETIADNIHRALAAILPLHERNDDVALLILRAAARLS